MNEIPENIGFISMKMRENLSFLEKVERKLIDL
jgi:hypothetical protein